ncbi:hypothetical protein STRCI_008653 [Streptomyces cinnabarinus]|uniref:Uncharacterized protein n=1 Tax=Streptomyces cinnabarinus TaxID=67287 RepID=A0ABY7KV32_9ACTN|nr:hypothetical protein [Streptomyces cinnabarinus]WAZ26962.1 hypothetical protein STRCI_008653 [Streptomyces cinnabarinus]
MLASLLPGLRDLRTPLAVGYLWLACAWLWFHDTLPRRETAHGAIADLYDLEGILPAAALLAVLTFFAYFLGSILVMDIAEARWLDVVRPKRTAWEAVADRFRNRLDDQEGMTSTRYMAAADAWRRAAPSRTVKRVTLATGGDATSVRSDLKAMARGVDWLEQRQVTFLGDAPLDTPADGIRFSYGDETDDGVRIVYQCLTLRVRHEGSWRCRHWAGPPVTGGASVEWPSSELPVAYDALKDMPTLAIATLCALRYELPDLATRLLIERPEIFDRYDRLLAEASIRINICPPMVALVATLAVRSHVLWWLGLTMCAALLYQGFIHRSQAAAVVLDSVATRLIESPTMLAVAEAQHGEPEDSNRPTISHSPS